VITALEVAPLRLAPAMQRAAGFILSRKLLWNRRLQKLSQRWHSS
jgi:hypothetical protein